MGFAPTDGSSTLPIEYAQDAAEDFVNNFFLPLNNPTGNNKVAVVSFGTDVTTEIGLVGSASQSAVINAINNIVVGGWTNTEGAIITADNIIKNQGSFNCATSRNIILLTDGVPTWEQGATNNCSVSSTSSCTLSAITAGVNAQTHVVSGETYDTKIFSIGLVGSLDSGDTQIATDFLNAVQTNGSYLTTNNADLTGIYSQILGQLIAVAKQLPGQPLVSGTVISGFDIVPGTLIPSKGTADFTNQMISWFVDEIGNETITLEYSIVAVTTGVCGIQQPDSTVMNYEDSSCQVVSAVFDSPEICTPCPEAVPSISRIACTSSVDYTAVVDQGGCNSLSDSFGWEFTLNGNVVGTSSTLSGTFNYTGAAPFEGDFSAELVYNGTYGTGCVLPTITASDSIDIPEAPEGTVVVTDILCNGDSTGAIDLTIINGFATIHIPME